MAETAISADVKAANSKLAQFLRAKEEEEMLLQIGKRKPKAIEEKRQPGGRARWAAPPNFFVPTPMVDRPRTVTGATSFHFSFRSISKEAVPTVAGKPVSGSYNKAPQPALDHAKYIERDGAAEVSAGAHHAAYVERPGAVEMVDPATAAKEGVERSIALVVNERPTDEEAKLLGVQDVAPEGIPSVFSNISNDPFEREEYWRAVERTERSPKTHRIFLDPESSDRWWQHIETADGLDPTFRNHVLQQAERYRQHLENEASSGHPGKAFSSEPLRVTAEQAGKFIEQAMSQPGYDHSRPPLEFKSGRGGRVQMRFVAELPHEVSPEDRALIVQNFCDKLGSLEERKDASGETHTVGMMYTAVIHAPDPHNDARNYHLHVVAHDRPARFLEAEGQWDFEVQEYFRRSGSGSERVRYPHRQNKIGEIARAGNGADFDKAGRNFVPHMRKQFADITNTVLKARGIERHYDPRKYTEMGIDRTPTEHLGTKAAALEAIGVPTTVGQLNAIAIWNDAERSIARRAKAAKRSYKEKQDKLVRLAQEATTTDPSSALLTELRAKIARRENLIADVAEDREAIMSFDHMEAKAKSRAIRTRQTCVQFLADIENGNADRNTRIMQSTIKTRWKAAQAHIDKIDSELAPHRETMKEAAKSVERRERQIEMLDRELQSITTDLEKALSLSLKSNQVNPPDASRPTAPEPNAKPEIPQDQAQAPGEPKTGPDKRSAADQATEKGSPAETRGEPANANSKTASASQTKDDLSAQTGPSSIDGVPIVEGTIAPPRGPSEGRSSAAGTPTPDGLSPLRPAPPVELPKDTSEIVIADLSADPSSAPKTGGKDVEPNEPSKTDQGPETPAPNAPQADKVDKRRKPNEPALFDLPAQEAPVKPGTKKAEHADWEAVIQRVTAERIPIKSETLKNGKLRFTVPSLSPDDNAVLHAQRFAFRTNNRLAAIHDRQQHEIKRLSRWITEQGTDPSKLKIEGATVRLGAVPKAIKTLMRNWGQHANILETIRDENARRISEANEAARRATAPAQPTPAPDGPSRQEQLTDAAAKYPAPDQVYTPEVAEFTKLLRSLADTDALQAAADAIRANASAREDINRHTVELATAYSRHAEGADLRNAQRERSGKDIRG